MKVYFYHTQDIQRLHREWEEGLFPGHFLYGATLLGNHGIDVIWHKHKSLNKRWRIAINVSWQILTCRHHYDALYATSFRGLEPIIFMRALGLYHHPIVLWHHQPIKTAKNWFREAFAHLFYRGIDEMFFFSQNLINMSMLSSKANPAKMHFAHWGADIDFYDALIRKNDVNCRHGFISTGGEKRDFPTLVSALNRTRRAADLYIGGSNNISIISHLNMNDNISIHYINGQISGQLAVMVNKASCVLICCQETDYTVGLTTVVEALALGLPMICSRNPQMPIDIDNEKCGIFVDYYDTEGWVNAIEYISSHPDEAKEMGQNGRNLAERVYNERQCAKDVAEILVSLHM